MSSDDTSVPTSVSSRSVVTPASSKRKPSLIIHRVTSPGNSSTLPKNFVLPTVPQESDGSNIPTTPRTPLSTSHSSTSLGIRGSIISGSKVSAATSAAIQSARAAAAAGGKKEPGSGSTTPRSSSPTPASAGGARRKSILGSRGSVISTNTTEAPLSGRTAATKPLPEWNSTTFVPPPPRLRKSLGPTLAKAASERLDLRPSVNAPASARLSIIGPHSGREREEKHQRNASGPMVVSDKPSVTRESSAGSVVDDDPSQVHAPPLRKEVSNPLPLSTPMQNRHLNGLAPLAVGTHSSRTSAAPSATTSNNPSATNSRSHSPDSISSSPATASSEASSTPISSNAPSNYTTSTTKESWTASAAYSNRRQSTLSLQQLQQQQYASNPALAVSQSSGPTVYTPLVYSSTSNQQNINVVVRCRPFIRDEVSRAGGAPKRSVGLTPNSVSCMWKKEVKKFNYDLVFNEDATQHDVYVNCAGSLIDQALQGYNCTIFAYGQTGSGKTHTILGDLNENSDQNGIVPSAVDHIFSYIDSQHATPSMDDNAGNPQDPVSSVLGNLNYLVSLSALEIYNEHVHDLLSFSGAKVNLDVREDVASGSFHVPNLSKHIVTNRTELIRLIQRGNENRSTTATLMNEYSSRSHSMVTICIEKSFKRPSGDVGSLDENGAADGTMIVQSKLNLVDLAGSERLTTSAAEQTGRETRAINLSLTTLANVIAALTSPNERLHVPYRDSKLTRLLKDSLGGNSLTLMVACINPAEPSLPETVSTLRYASRAKRIVNNARVNEDPRDSLLRELHEEISNLKSMLVEKNKLALRMFHLVNDLQIETAPDAPTSNTDGALLMSPEPVFNKRHLGPNGKLLLTDGSATTEVTTTTTVVAAIQTTTTTTTTASVADALLIAASSPSSSPLSSPSASSPPAPADSKETTPEKRPEGSRRAKIHPRTGTTPTSSPSANLPAPTTLPPLPQISGVPAAAPVEPAPVAPAPVTPIKPPSTDPSTAVTVAVTGSPVSLDFESSEGLLRDPFNHPQLSKILHSPNPSISMSYQQVKALQLATRERGATLDLDEAVAGTNATQEALLSAFAAENSNFSQGISLTAMIDKKDDKESTELVPIAPGASSDAISTLSNKKFYASFKNNVLNLYTTLMDTQAKLAHKKLQHNRALDHIRHLESVIDAVRQQEKEQAAEEAEDLANNVAAESLDAVVALPESKIDGELIGISDLQVITVTSPAVSQSTDIAPLSPDEIAKLKASRRNSSATHSRRTSSVGVDQLLQRKGSLGGNRNPGSALGSALNSPRNAGETGLNRTGDSTDGAYTPDPEFSLPDDVPELKEEKQRFLQLQASLEALRSQLDEKEEELTLTKALHAKQLSEMEWKAKRDLEKAQDEALDRMRRLEDVECELDGKRMNEDALAALLSNHHTTVSTIQSTSGSSGGRSETTTPSRSISRSHSPSPRNSLNGPVTSPLAGQQQRSATPSTLLSPAPSASNNNGAWPNGAASPISPAANSSATSNNASGFHAVTNSPVTSSNATGTPSFGPLMSSFDGKIGYLRQVLQTSADQAALIPKLYAILKQSDRQIAELQATVKQSGEEGDLYRQMAEKLRDREAVSLKRVEQLTGEQIVLHAQLEKIQSEHAQSGTPSSSSAASSSSSSQPPDVASLLAKIAALEAEKQSLIQLNSTELQERINLQKRLDTLSQEHAAFVAAVESVATAVSASVKPDGTIAYEPPASSPNANREESQQWMHQTMALQNNILELAAELQHLRNSKRELAKNCSQELQKMRADLQGGPGSPPNADGSSSSNGPVKGSSRASSRRGSTDRPGHNPSKSCQVQ